MRLTDNDMLLSSYFTKKIAQGNLIPYMTKISDETGISISTISRYAKRKGYYNFPEMRAKINVDLNKGTKRVIKYKKLKDFIFKRKKKKFVIATSVSCQTIGYHISKRLNDINISSRFIDHAFLNKEDAINNISNDEVIIFITISGESAWLHSLEKSYKNEIAVISIQKLENLPKKYINISLAKKEKITNIYNKYQNIRKIFIWMDDVLNEITIELKK